MLDFYEIETLGWVSLPHSGKGWQPTKSHSCYPLAGPVSAHVIVFLNTLKSPQLLQFMAFFYLFSQCELQLLTARAGTCYSITWSHQLCSDGSSDPARGNYI